MSMGFFDALLLIVELSIPLLLAVIAILDWVRHRRGRYLLLAVLHAFFAVVLLADFFSTTSGGTFVCLPVVVWLSSVFHWRSCRADRTTQERPILTDLQPLRRAATSSPPLHPPVTAPCELEARGSYLQPGRCRRHRRLHCAAPLAGPPNRGFHQNHTKPRKARSIRKNPLTRFFPACYFHPTYQSTCRGGGSVSGLCSPPLDCFNFSVLIHVDFGRGEIPVAPVQAQHERWQRYARPTPKMEQQIFRRFPRLRRLLRPAGGPPILLPPGDFTGSFHCHDSPGGR
jgi:hypothetical protein